jgi:hypothetical protein
MATTTNYGWTTPDDTALVKDGASAIRTLGSSVDTTTKALNPSTTFGDIEYRSSTANTNTRLGIGTTGQVLTVSGGVPSWATASSGGMTLISTTTLTGASVTLSSIPGTYNDLKIVIQNWKPASDTYLRCRFNGVTSASYFNNDALNGYYASTDMSATTYLEFNSTTNGDNSDNANLNVLILDNYANTTTYKIGTSNYYKEGANGTDKFGTFSTIYFFNTSAISSIEFTNGTGNFTSGTVLLYGVK